MNIGNLIAIAKLLAKVGSLEIPNQDELRISLSSAYYALFHAICHCVADQWVGEISDMRGTVVWAQAYRILEHGKTRSACKKICKILYFSKELKYFAEIFIYMQHLRFLADYDPSAEFSVEETIEAIEKAELAIQKLLNANELDRLEFVTFLALPQRRN